LTDARPGQRRRARECALQALYQLDHAHRARTGDVRETLTAESVVDRVLTLYWAHLEPDGNPGDDVVTYTDTLVRGVDRERARLDGAIERASQHWRMERMAVVDRNVLRLAAYELFHETDVPTRAVLNEAIEIAKRYGSDDSGGFVNGVLDRIAREARG